MFNIFKRRANKKSGITLVAGNCQLIGDVHFTDQLLVNGVWRAIFARNQAPTLLT